MFRYLPFPYFISILVIALIMDVYYILKLRNGPKKFLIIPLHVTFISCIATIVMKCIDQWADGTTLQAVFIVIEYITGTALILTYLTLGISKYQKRHVTGKRRKYFVQEAPHKIDRCEALFNPKEFDNKENTEKLLPLLGEYKDNKNFI